VVVAVVLERAAAVVQVDLGLAPRFLFPLILNIPLRLAAAGMAAHQMALAQKAIIPYLAQLHLLVAVLALELPLVQTLMVVPVEVAQEQIPVEGTEAQAIRQL